MPIYEYKCLACGHEMSHFHRSRAEPPPPCKSCGADDLEKLISLSSFSLKGEGWYVSDYSKASSAGKTEQGSQSDSSSASDASAGESASSPTSSKNDTAAPASSAGAAPTSGSKSTSDGTGAA